MCRRALLLVACAAVLAAAQSPVGATAETAPRLTLVSSAPLAVRGRFFEPRERVVVTAFTLAGPRRVVVRATAGGFFSVTIRTANQPCARAFAIRAVGACGSLATLRVTAGACIPPPRD